MPIESLVSDASATSTTQCCATVSSTEPPGALRESGAPQTRLNCANAGVVVLDDGSSAGDRRSIPPLGARAGEGHPPCPAALRYDLVAVSDGRSSWRTRLGEFVRGQQLLGGLLGSLIVAGVALAALLSAHSAPRPSPGPGPAHSSSTTNTPAAPQPTFLSVLLTSGGDNPQTGDTQIDGEDFPNSVFYTQVNSLSSSQACQTAAYQDCRGTSWSLGAGYRRFTALLGVTNTSVSSGENAQVSWEVIGDQRVLRSGTFVANGPIRPISVPIAAQSSLTLVVSTNEPGLSEVITIVWGNARVS